MTKGPLAGLTVLLVRPVNRQANLLQAIEHLGGHCVSYPVMAIAPLTAARDSDCMRQCQQCFQQLQRFQHVIFISCNAVHFGLQWIKQCWPLWPSVTKRDHPQVNAMHWYAIGATTQRALHTKGLWADHLHQARMNSEALLEHPQLQAIRDHSILIVRGMGGRDYLADQLKQRGARVQYAECYRRMMVNQPMGELGRLIMTTHVSTIVVHSGESLDYSLTLIGPAYREHVQSLPLAVPSERVAHLAKRLGFRTIYTAANATDDAMITILSTIAAQTVKG